MTGRYDYTPGQARIVGLWSKSGRPVMDKPRTTQWQLKPFECAPKNDGTPDVPERVELVKFTPKYDASVKPFVPLNHAPNDHYIERYNKINDWLEDGLYTIEALNIYQIPKILTDEQKKAQMAYDVKFYRKLRAAVRKIDDYPMPPAVPGDRARPQQLRAFATSRGYNYPSALAKNQWYEQFPNPHADVNTHLSAIRAHYARIGDRVEKPVKGKEFELSNTAYLKWWKKGLAAAGQNTAQNIRDTFVPGTMFHNFAYIFPTPKIELEDGLRLAFIGYSEKHDRMVAGLENVLDVPTEQFGQKKPEPLRCMSEVDFLDCEPDTMTQKEKVWWSGEVYRLNVRKDGMRRVSTPLFDIVGHYFGISGRQVKRSAQSSEPLIQARGKLAALTKSKQTASAKGSGFVGIRWNEGLEVVRMPNLASKWIAPWYLG